MNNKEAWGTVQSYRRSTSATGKTFDEACVIRMSYVLQPVIFRIADCQAEPNLDGKKVPWLYLEDADGKLWKRPMNQLNINYFVDTFDDETDVVGMLVRLSPSTGKLFGKEFRHVGMEVVDEPD